MPYARAGTPGKALEFFQPLRARTRLRPSTCSRAWPSSTTTPASGRDHAGLPQADEREARTARSSATGRAASPTLRSPAATRSKGVTEVQRLVDVFELPPPAANARKTEEAVQAGFASTLVDLATAWHREAIRHRTPSPAPTTRRTMDALPRRSTACCSRKFPDVATLEFPEIDKRDWPDRVPPRLTSTRSFSGRWSVGHECAPAFDKVD